MSPKFCRRKQVTPLASCISFALMCCIAGSAYAAAGDPVAHWRFDEGTGTQVRNAIGGTATGSFMTPNPTWSSDVPSVSFSNPYSLSFTNTGDGVQFAWPSALNFTGTEERSFSFWYKPTANGETASGNYDRIMSWTGDAFEIAGTYGDVSVHRLAFYDGSWRDTGYDLTVGTWYNITFTYDGTNVKLYVAGDEKFSGTSAGRDINGTLYIGVRHTGDEGINGRIDDVRIYDYALNTSQINNIVSGSDNPDAAPAPTLSGALLPADNGTGVTLDSDLVINFSQNVQTGTGNIVIKKLSDNSIHETIPATDDQVTGSGGRAITINPGSNLEGNTEYYVQIGANAFKNSSGVHYAGFTGSGTWNFTTVASASSSSSTGGSGNVGGSVKTLRQQNGLDSRGYPLASSSSSSASSDNNNSSSSISSVQNTDSSSSASATSSVHAEQTHSAASFGESAVVTKEGVILRDVRMDSWFGVYVKKLVDLNIFEGYKDPVGKPLGIYGPNDTITLGQLAKVGALLGNQEVTPVNGSEWATPYLEAAKTLRLSVFLENINPNTPATRGAVVQTIMEALNIPMDETRLPYSDVPTDSPYWNAIASATTLGIVSGDSDATTFRPNEPINRAEVAKMAVAAWEVER